jgi:DNA adenine methylase
LSVLLNKPPAWTEVASDLDAALMQFYRCLRDRPKDLTDRLRSIAYTARSFAWACETGGDRDPIESAAKFLVRNRFSRGGLGQTFAWSNRLRGGQPGNVNAWATIVTMLPAIASRLQGVTLLHANAFDVISQCDSAHTLFYLDPPYMHSTRTAQHVYHHELDVTDHVKLLNTITSITAKVVISGYHCPLYDRALRDWDRHEFDMPNHSGQGKTKQHRVEVLWSNFGQDQK